MTGTEKETVEHTHFTIQRTLATRPERAFRFWSDAGLKERWNGCHPDWKVVEDVFDFRPGGSEYKQWRTPEGQDQTFTAHYLDIVEGERIIYAYEMSFSGKRLSASLVTIILKQSGTTTLMSYTEQVAILDGGADAKQQRLMGTEQGIDRLVEIINQGTDGI